jgi:ubiquinone biosynthesis monooxygenase Coq7
MLNILDKVIIELDKVVKTLFTKPISQREHPDHNIAEAVLSINDQKKIVGLMRINHCGEICAQGLYQGQALTSRTKSNQEHFAAAAFEETEHLAWTERRIHDLGGHTSWLNPLFYGGSLAIGISAGLLGDKWSLGFLEETERQVGAHLAKHLRQLPPADNKSQAILQQMQADETAHAEMAHKAGAEELPMPVKALMQLSSKIMTKTTYYI